MSMQPVTRLRGMYDLPREPWRRKRDLQDSLVSLIGTYGYRFLETPILEPTELFIRKSGGDLASRMYSFIDAGSNSVSLRPEFTSPVMRYYLENASGTDSPARLQYAGPVFRYEVSHPEGQGQFTQVGAELLGSSSVMADAELLTLAASLPVHAGLSGCRVELADLDVFHSVLDVTRVSDRARTFILENVPKLMGGRAALPEIMERAYQLHLGDRSPENQELSAAIVGLDDDQARQVIQGFLQWNGVDNRGFGQRDPDQVVGRFLRKLRGSDELGRLERGLALAADLAAISGEPISALKAARQVVQEAGADLTAVNRLSKLLDILLASPEIGAMLTVDFGLARGLAYYSGIVFEVKHPGWPEPLGGGGRYDGLARALGSGKDVPALGFAYTLETLLALVGDAEVNSTDAIRQSITLVLAETPESYPAAFRLAEQLRREGEPAELEVAGRGLSDSLEYATACGMSRVLLVHPEGNQTSYDTAGEVN